MDKQIKDMICKQIDVELDKISNMPSLTDVALNNLQKLTDTKKNFLKIELLESQLNGDMEDGGSYRRGYSRRDGGYSNTYMAPQYHGGSYDMGMGGYSRTDTYSHIEAAMRDARNDQEREEIRQLMSRYHN